MRKILTTKNLPDIKEKAKNSIHKNINDNFDSFSAEDSSHTNDIPIQTISFDAGELSPNFVYYERQAMNNSETYHAWVSVGDPNNSNKDPLVWAFHDWRGPDAKMQDLSNTNFWTANSNSQTFKNKKDIKVTLYFHNTFGTRGPAGNTPDNAANKAAEYIGETGESDKIHNYMKFDKNTGILTIRTTNIP